MSYYKEEYQECLSLLDDNAGLSNEERETALKTLYDIQKDLDREIYSQELTTRFYDDVSKGVWKRAKQGGVVFLCLGGLTIANTLLKSAIPELDVIQNPAEFATNVAGCFTAIMATFRGVLGYMNKGNKEYLEKLAQEKEEIFAVESKRLMKQVLMQSEELEK